MQDVKPGRLFDGQIRKPGNVTDCGTTERMSLSVSSKTCKGRKLSKVHDCETKLLYKDRSGCTATVTSSKQAFPITPSHRSAHLRHILKDIRAVASCTAEEDSHACRQDTVDLGHLETGFLQGEQADDEEDRMSLNSDRQYHDGLSITRTSTELHTVTCPRAKNAHVACSSSVQQTQEGELPVKQESMSSAMYTTTKDLGVSVTEELLRWCENSSKCGQWGSTLSATTPDDGPITSRVACKVPNDATARSCSSHTTLTSTVAATNEAQKQALAISDMRYRVVQGSVPGVLRFLMPLVKPA